VAQQRPLENPIHEVMSTQLITVERDDLLFEALLKMLRDNIHHLPVMHRQQIVGVLSLSDLISQETQNSLFVVSHIFHCTSVAELVALKPDVEAAYCRLVQEDASSHMIGSALSTIGRSFKQQLLTLAEAELGPPPVPYCFLALGSMARDEQLMGSDQDNALILSNEFDAAQHDAYFAQLSQFVCTGLAELGYAYCKGDIMATNPKLRLTESEWQQTFQRWIDQPNPEALLLSAIFFDLDGVAGELPMASRLQTFIAEQASQSPHFLGCLARNALNRTPPLGFFRDFVVEKTGSHRNSVNLKRRGTAPLVDVIRVHALAAGSTEQNTFARLDDLVANGWLTSSAVADLRDAFEFISLVRIRHQARAIEAGQPPSNNLNPEHLSSFERRSLKDAFQVLSRAQKFLKFRYRPGPSI
jgi:CBS domain-containing protein